MVATSRVFLASRSLVDLAEPRVNGTLLYDRYEEIRDLLESRVGPEAAQLLARPEVTRGNGVAVTSVAWYAPRSGNARVWRDLDDETQTRIAAELGVLLERMRPLLADPVHGPLIQRCLLTPGLSDTLHVIADRPVIVDWGLLPADAIQSHDEREKLHRRGFGRFAAWLPLPPFHAGEGMDLAPDRARAAMPAGASTAVPGAGASAAIPPTFGASAQTAGSGATATGAVAPVEPAVIVVERPWLPVAIAAAIALLLLLVLLIPGVLLYPAATPVIADDATLEASEAALRERIASLRRALDTDICSVGPDGIPPQLDLILPWQDGSLRSFRPQIAEGPPSATPAPVTVPPSPRQIEVEPPSSDTAGPPSLAQGGASLVDALDRAAVLVLAPDPARPGTVSTGSGFFVNATDVVTNLHVVEDADPARLLVVNTALGKPVAGRLVARSAAGAAEIGRPDFAVIRIEADAPHGTLELAGAVRRVDNVMAYGYPAFVMETDETYNCLLAGDPACVPVGSVTTGTVSAVQSSGPDLSLAVHTAAIAKGNSGGPLVDYCGRVIGVNTFLRHDAEIGFALNFAQPPARWRLSSTPTGFPTPAAAATAGW
ncbi:trypsin-like peptidase domain-containing protein [Methylobrevis pamukkalensis]|uniref:Putative serine protease HhoA n=1 Tax=Methylobrevis pamukkalensis TaxID=1439726 RepID=A0A1E3GXX5_9HYPH|nr:trypsin-like peptidase domain-containing protein [Methylobrevis pamukkalensis]ODN68775.1 putative serine protease HhoA precursor [Methylobrevis pamukkalensis]